MKRKFLHFVNNLTFAYKLVFLFLCGIIFPIILQNGVYYYQTEKNVQEEMLEKIDEAMNDKADKISDTLSGIVSLARTYYTNETLYMYLDHQYGTDLEYLIRYQEGLKALFPDSNLYTYQVLDASVYTDNSTLFNGTYVHKTQDIDLELLGEDLTYLNLTPIGSSSNMYFRVANKTAGVPSVSDTRSISILCVLDYYPQYSDSEKVLRLDVDLTELVEILKESNMFENMFLIDDQAHVVAAATAYANSGEMAVFSEETYLSADGMVMLSVQVDGYPLTLYGIYDSGMISKEFDASRSLSVCISILCILLSAMWIYIVIGNMNERLSRLTLQSRQIAGGDFAPMNPPMDGRDEFVQLEKSMNQMALQLEDMMKREQAAAIRQAQLESETDQAKLHALQSQVNPHFMFNVLESVRLKALVKGETETAGIIKYLAAMFRNVIEWDNDIISLGEEIRFLDEFLHIQNYRYGDDLTYEINVSKEASSCLIQKMILQPLVENSCVHGFGAGCDTLHVGIIAYIEGDHLVVRVEDNGVGLSPENLSSLRAALQKDEKGTKAVGLWNVSRRLRLYYGEQALFEIDSHPGCGTVCLIEIPACTL